MDRKNDHIELAKRSITSVNEIDLRFNYEPLLGKHPNMLLKKKIPFLGKELSSPVWISSITGGFAKGTKINKNLACAAKEFGLGMGLGSCRFLLDDNSYFESVNMRPIIGANLPFYVNLGIAQIDKLMRENQIEKVEKLVNDLHACGVIVHINPLQEWFQKEGDVIERPIIETLREYLSITKCKTIVKEVGQGFGPKSMEELIQLPIDAIEFGAFGGTNFSKLEWLRVNDRSDLPVTPMANVGHSCMEMVDNLILLVAKLKERVRCKNYIVSGGVKSFLDGFYYLKKLQNGICDENFSFIYGMASPLLDHATGSYELLKRYLQEEIRGLELAYQFLEVRGVE